MKTNEHLRRRREYSLLRRRRPHECVCPTFERETTSHTLCAWHGRMCILKTRGIHAHISVDLRFILLLSLTDKVVPISGPESGIESRAEMMSPNSCGVPWADQFWRPHSGPNSGGGYRAQLTSQLGRQDDEDTECSVPTLSADTEPQGTA